MTFLLGLIFSWAGISIVTVALGVAAFMAFTRGWMHVAIGLAVGAALFAYTGTLVQLGEGICEDRVERAVEREQQRQGKVIDDVVEGTRARADKAEAESDAKDKEIEEYERELTRRIAEGGTVAPGSDCSFVDDDIKRLRSIAR